MLTFLVGAFGFAAGFWVAVWATAAGRADLKRKVEGSYERGWHDCMNANAQALRKRHKTLMELDEAAGLDTETGLPLNRP
jgi:hypothetical protein